MCWFMGGMRSNFNDYFPQRLIPSSSSTERMEMGNGREFIFFTTANGPASNMSSREPSSYGLPTRQRQCGTRSQVSAPSSFDYRSFASSSWAKSFREKVPNVLCDFIGGVAGEFDEAGGTDFVERGVNAPTMNVNR